MHFFHSIIFSLNASYRSLCFISHYVFIPQWMIYFRSLRFSLNPFFRYKLFCSLSFSVFSPIFQSVFINQCLYNSIRFIDQCFLSFNVFLSFVLCLFHIFVISSLHFLLITLFVAPWVFIVHYFITLNFFFLNSFMYFTTQYVFSLNGFYHWMRFTAQLVLITRWLFAQWCFIVQRVYIFHCFLFINAFFVCLCS